MFRNFASLSFEELAQQAARAAGNWRRFPFTYRQVISLFHPKPDAWAVVHTHNAEDAYPVAHAGAKLLLSPFDGKEVHFSTLHTVKETGEVACGFSIRVYDERGDITPAFKKWCSIRGRFEAYPVLDEEGFAKKYFDEAINSIRENLAHYIVHHKSHAAYLAIWRWLWVVNPGVLHLDGPKRITTHGSWKVYAEANITLKHALFALIDLNFLLDDAACVLRDVAVENYRLQTWDLEYRCSTGQEMVAYQFTRYRKRGALSGGEILFRGEVGCAPSEAIDSDDCLRGAMSSITMQPGDVDAHWFEDYTPEQMNFAETEAEELSEWGREPQADDEYPPLIFKDWIPDEPEIHGVLEVQKEMQAEGER